MDMQYSKTKENVDLNVTARGLQKFFSDLSVPEAVVGLYDRDEPHPGQADGKG